MSERYIHWNVRRERDSSEFEAVLNKASKADITKGYAEHNGKALCLHMLFKVELLIPLYSFSTTLLLLQVLRYS